MHMTAFVFSRGPKRRARDHRESGDRCANGGGVNSILEGSFSIFDWSGYPVGVPKPEGPFRLLEGAEYETARDTANVANSAIRRQEGLVGQQVDIHEIKPVKFGGSPTDLANKVILPRDLHRRRYTMVESTAERHRKVNMTAEKKLKEGVLNPPASEIKINEIVSSMGCPLPSDYAQFLLRHDGGEGYIGESYLILWKVEELIPFNREYDVEQHAQAFSYSAPMAVARVTALIYGIVPSRLFVFRLSEWIDVMQNR